MIQSTRKFIIFLKSVIDLSKRKDAKMNEETKISALDVANYLVYLLNGACDDLTNFKVNKLLYFIQGHYLKKQGTTLFNDPIEAWSRGPVVPSVYHKYKKFKNNPITEWSEVNIINDEDKSFIFDIARTYCSLSSTSLYKKTHKDGSPWDRVYKEDESHIPIPTDSIQEYFIKNEEEIKPFSPCFSDSDFIGYRDEEGILVLPKDWHD